MSDPQPPPAVPGARRPAEKVPPPAPAASQAASALNLDLRVGRVEAFHTISIDLAELVADRERDWRVLHRVRASDGFFGPVRQALRERVDGCVDEAEGHVRPRMGEAVALGGKAVWTEVFLDRFAPIRLPALGHLQYNQRNIGRDTRLSDNPRSPLHGVRFRSAALKMFHDGTLTYTIHTAFTDDPAGAKPAGPRPPGTIQESIVRLTHVERLIAENFRAALANLLRLGDFREAIREGVRAGDAKHPDGRVLELLDPADLEAYSLKRPSKEHRIVFVEEFFDGAAVERAVSAGAGDFAEAAVEPRSVLSSAPLAGLLNAATWYHRYNAGYVASLSDREVGYRDDEIFLTDPNATVVSAAGFWREEGPDGTAADPLTRYKWDVVLAVEYQLARLAYLSSTLGYYRTHADVQGLENCEPLDALRHVVGGHSILSYIDDSLDLSLTVDHGFTRLFIRRLREELGIAATLTAIRGRVADASTTVALRSGVLAAENTSKRSLEAAVANLETAYESLQLQRRMQVWAVVAIVVAALMSTATLLVQVWLAPAVG